MEMTFKAWFLEVDRIVGNLVGMGVNDLPDMLHRDAYDDGISAEDWAREVVASACEDMGFDPSDILG